MDFKEKDYFVSPKDVLKHIYTYMHDIAASHCSDVNDSNTVITVPLGYSQEQREIIKQGATAAGFRVVQVESRLFWEIYFPVNLVWEKGKHMEKVEKE